jgi:radical SAM protein with 4Fe4S-binding SPASM domain
MIMEKKRFQKVYLEISTLCNLNCAFCPGTKRVPHVMPEDDFSLILQKIRPWTDFVYFHLMGEPLCHPKLERYLELAHESRLKVILTTNGTLLRPQMEVLRNAPGLHKVNISLHAFEANDLNIPFEEYLKNCFSFAEAVQGQKIVVFRLWNEGGLNQRNQQILDAMEKFFPKPWVESRRGIRIGTNVFLEYGEKFDWPDLEAQEGSERVFCYGLRDQIGILCDGTVVPCCLDHEGDLVLGNLLSQDMEQILSSNRAKAIWNGFSQGIASEELCRKCGYARRFSK